MTKTEFPGLGLSDDQWESLKALASSLNPQQSTWVGGYFTGFGDGVRSLDVAPPKDVAPAVVPVRTLTVLYGSETGTGTALAGEVLASAIALGLSAKAIDMADYEPSALKQEDDLIVITSTHGDGDPPQPAIGFFEFMGSRKAPRLDNLRFAVLALGDSTYEFFCGAGRHIDQRLGELGANRLAERIDCDVDQIPAGKTWAKGVLESLVQSRPTVVASAEEHQLPARRAADQDNPVAARLLENLVITGRGSSKQTRHIELDLEESGLTYEPGDALGIVARNGEELLDGLLEVLSLDEAEAVQIDGETLSLRAALASKCEIASATPRFLEQWARLSGAASLSQMSVTERLAYLESNHVIDIVRQYPASGLSAAEFLAGLRRLQPRLYSIASSQSAHQGEVHLTVSTVRYALHGSERLGVVTGSLCDLPDDAALPVYVRPNPHFRLPKDDVPIIMVGAGTGIAPFRAFIQERRQRAANGKAWLFFGDRNFRSDFLYQSEWQGHLRDGVLSRMDVAFSRDPSGRAYVQQRIREAAAELFAWLEEGAHFYVCGDAKGLAPDVNATLTDLVADAGGLGREHAEEYVRDLQRQGRYQRDVY